MRGQQPFDFNRGPRRQFRGTNRENVFEAMTDGISREETRQIIDDKLDAVEARGDAKLAEISGKLDLMFAELRHQGEAVSSVKSDVAALRTDVRDDYKHTRTTIIVTAVGSVLAIVALLLTSQANLLTAFQTGLSAISAVSTE